MPYFGYRQILGPIVRRKIKSVDGQKNLPDKPPFIIAANHEGFLDGPSLTMLILDRYNQPTYYLTKRRMWWYFGGPLASSLLAMIPVCPGQKAGALVEAVKAVEQGKIIGIFPEGSRNLKKELTKGKTGAVRLAIATGVPLIPVGIKNSTGRSLYNAYESLWHKDRVVNVNFGKPVDLSEFKNKLIDKPLLEAATRKLMLAIGNLCGKAYNY